MRKFYWLLTLLIFSGCATISIIELDKLYGTSNVENRLAQPPATEEQNKHYNQHVKGIIENRCVVCHGCYDAPCQLKMESSAGIARGANKTIVYNGERLTTEKASESLDKLTDFTRESLLPLRQQGFFPVLNERQQTPQANAQAGLLYQMLALKKQHPLPNTKLLDDSFDIALDRDQQCPTIEEFNQYKNNYPLGGMPYALPGLNEQEHETLSNWIVAGAYMPPLAVPSADELNIITRWESLLNGESNKSKLIARYLFEHLYLANLYFDEKTDQAQSSYFKLVRSSTPSGEDVSVISTRRPFDPPFPETKTDNENDNNKQTPVYYRLIKHTDTVTAKRHMPYPFGEAKLSRINELFYQPNYQVSTLPDYKLAHAANPFKTFKAIPAKSRYLFLLDQAQYSIMNFIKGPVCRGQVALNVIEDNFWVMFLNPDNFDQYPTSDFISDNANLLQLPASTSNKTVSLLYWRQYAKNQQKYVQKKLTYLENLKIESQALNLDLLWSGDSNPNATLTVFRHFDSASVLQGFVGPTPKTAWLISYPILERIHYLLVAGFDVYGNVSHQLKTRLYMDFLRMEAEANFISLLPISQRKKVHEHWYRDTSADIKDYIFSNSFYQLPESGIQYQTADQQTELYGLVAEHTTNKQVNNFNIDASTQDNSDKLMVNLAELPNKHIALLPQVSYVMVHDGPTKKVYTIINNTAHSNVAQLFSEDDRRLPNEDTLAILRGVVGTYPNAFFNVQRAELPNFVETFTLMQTEHDYSVLKDQFAIRRTNPDFWAFADELHSWYKKHQPESAGLLDFNRLENR